ncbi:unnamed protein product [Ceutorhynchus assimilis]|uniref:Uncharacterized protein n=1 Tax=Ceutorhynchus assimilis TaxID=467358 RepID=A0A9N9MTV6_9CUCU|nr:unnamed protein product [Ceutorhynchus assimilis]
MADKSTVYIDDYQFHPGDVPRGMTNYDYACLTKKQQQRLNNHRVEIMRENQNYLFKHPEIRGVIQIVLRQLLRERPSHDIHTYVSNWFAANTENIFKDVNKYVEKVQKPIPVESKTQVKEEKHVKLEDRVFDGITSKSSSEELLPDEIKIVKDLLNEILDKIYTYKDDESEDKISFRRQHSEDTDEDIIFDLGLDFDLDFSAYHEEDDS